MNCCNDQGDCTQGRNCPVRVQRQRAGQPAKYDVAPSEPLRATADDIEAMMKQDRSDALAALFIFACILVLIALMVSFL